MKTEMGRRKFLKASTIATASLVGGTLLSGKEREVFGATRKEFRAPVESLPAALDADVVVIGGGPGGFGAAIRAVRMGARVVLVEKGGMPGGVHTSNLQGSYREGVGGTHTELMKRLAAEGHVFTATEKLYPSLAGNPIAHYDWKLKSGSPFRTSTFNPEAGGCVMMKMLEEAKVTVLYDTAFVDVVTRKLPKGVKTIEAIIVENVSGRQAIKGKVFVDGSGTAEVVARAGAPFVRGGGPQPSPEVADRTNRPIPGGSLWIMTNIDFEKMADYQKSQDDPTLTKLISRALSAGDIPPHLYRPRLSPNTNTSGTGGTIVYGGQYIGHPTVDMSPIQGPGTFIFWQNVPYEWALHMDESAVDMTRARMVMRQFIAAEAKFLTKYVPGFENAFITNVGSYMGIRDARHPVGEYTFSIDDALKGTRFPDAVVTHPSRNSFNWVSGKNLPFEVPYRCFLPKAVNNLLLTGASLSFKYETIFMVMRGFDWCMQTGDIAGFAAAESVAQGIPPNQYKWKTALF